MKPAGLMRKGFYTLLVAGAVFATAESSALALSVDFTDGTWDAAQGTSSYTSHPSNVDIAAYGGTISVNYDGGPSGDDSGRDGLGINDDEITQGGTEKLKITFASAVTLNSVYITDLFKFEGPNGQSEVGWYSLNGSSTYTSFTSVGGTNGALTLNIFQSGVNYITFKSSNDTWSDFSVKGLNYSVPEPSAVLLLGIAFLALAAVIRKQCPEFVQAYK